MKLIPLYSLIALAFVGFVAFLIAASLDTRCPACRRRRLHRVQFIRATTLVDAERVPDYASYHQCRACGARFVQHRTEAPRPATDEEWRTAVARSG
jgi:hypothetical protein